MPDAGIELEADAPAVEARPVSSGAAPQSSANTEIRKIGRHTAVYAAGVALSKLAGFLMLPVYTRSLTPADYGVLELLTMTIDLIGTVVGVGIAASVFKIHADAVGKRAQDTVLSTAAISVLCISSLTATAGLLLSGPLTHTVLGASGRPIYFQLFFLIYLAETAAAIPMLLLRLQERSFQFVLVNLGKLVAVLALNIYFVVVLRMGVLGVLFGSLIANVGVAVLLSVYLFSNVGAHLSGPDLRRMARFGYPLSLWFIANFVVVFSDRYFINHYAGPSAVGLYSLGAKFAFLLSAFAFTPFQMIWDPQRFAIAKRPDAAQIYRNVFMYMNLALGTIALFIALFASDVIRVIAAPSFSAARGIVPLLLVSQIIFHWTAFANLGIFLRNKTHMLAIIAVNGVIAVLALNYLMVPRYGAWGAAIAGIIAYAVRFVTVYVVSQRQYHVDYPWSGVLRLYGILIATVFVRQLANHLPVFSSVAVSILLAVLAIVAIYHAVLGETERRVVRRVIAQPRAILSFVRT